MSGENGRVPGTDEAPDGRRPPPTSWGLMVHRTWTTIRMRVESARTVAVSGDFNHWDPVGIPLARNGNQDWWVRLDLEPGEHQYRLLIDGRWRDHPEATRRVPNPFGTENCVLSIA